MLLKPCVYIEDKIIISTLMLMLQKSRLESWPPCLKVNVLIHWWVPRSLAEAAYKQELPND